MECGVRTDVDTWRITLVNMTEYGCMKYGTWSMKYVSMTEYGCMKYETWSMRYVSMYG